MELKKYHFTSRNYKQDARSTQELPDALKEMFSYAPHIAGVFVHHENLDQQVNDALKYLKRHGSPLRYKYYDCYYMFPNIGTFQLSHTCNPGEKKTHYYDRRINQLLSAHGFSKEQVYDMSTIIEDGMAETDKLWDEYYLYHLLGINELLAHGDNSESLGDYMEGHEKELDTQFVKFQFTQNEHTTDLLDCYRKSPIAFRNRAWNKNGPLVKSLTKSEIIRYLKLPSSQKKRVTYSNYTRALKNFIDDVRKVSTSISAFDVESLLSSTFIKSMSANHDDITGRGLSTRPLYNEFHYLLDELHCGKKLSAGLQKWYTMATALHNNASNLKPVEVLSVLAAILNSNMAFRSCDLEKSLTIISTAVSSHNTVEAVRFITEMVLDYDDVLASYGEWMKNLSSADNSVFDLVPSLAIALMVGEGKTELKRYNNQRTMEFKSAMKPYL
jgi:hypothetical protein